MDATNDLHYLQRCVDLAQLADASVSPNPRVGAVLVHQGRILGEGYHQRHGQAHAEVNCLASVAKADRHLIPQATLYVSLEPCCIFGRTPPCTNLILANKIPTVVISQLDQTAEVAGRGVALLEAAGVVVRQYPQFEAAARLVAPRQIFATQQRPFVLLKYAQSADGFLAPEGQSPYWITQPISRRTTHYWRSRTAAILVGGATIIADNPSLNSRYYPGPSPEIVILDPNNRIQHSQYRLFENTSIHRKPLLFQQHPYPSLAAAETIALDPASWANLTASPPSPSLAKQLLAPLLTILHQRNINHLTVEGGAWVLSLFLQAGLWDEARVFTSTTTYFQRGLTAPQLTQVPDRILAFGKDQLACYYKQP